MKQISVSDLKTNTGKYVTMAQDQDILITKNGKIVAKLVTAKPDKKAALNHLMSLFNGVSFTDEEVRNAREEHLQ
ncbi:MAG: type II toxin-antitoxin system prevent-host-death family antitoxin [Bacteroidales bacterium]|nr:type II toxin-antitoxin system prevent-host-death family antitoxin [Bacteroidales bacterium]